MKIFLQHFLILISIFLPYFNTDCRASSLEFTFGGTAKEFPGEQLEWGIGLRAKFSTYNSSGGGGFVLWPQLQGNIFVSDYMAGYGYRSGGNMFYEFVGGLRYAPVWGAGVFGIAGLGFQVTNKFFISFPIVLKTISYQLWGFQYVPYLGITL